MKRPHIAIEETTLPNGLRIVVVPDHAVPTVTVGLYYRIGSRLEPRGGSGLAHLFEHMMFQGSANAPKIWHAKIIHSSGGKFNATTSYDWTNYFEAVPSNALERALWLEADRLLALKVDDENLRNQREVVKEEIRLNILNQPYGGFPFIDMPPVAFRNWTNVRGVYGDFADLDRVNVSDVRDFFDTYYVPNNAVLLMLGDVTPEEGIRLSEKFFGEIPRRAVPDLPNTNEEDQAEERRGYVEERLGELPAMAIGFVMPKRRTRDWYAMALLDQAIHGGRAGRVYRELVLKMQFALQANGGIDDLFSYSSPSQMITQLWHKPEYSSEEVLGAFDSVIREIRENGIPQDELEQLKVRWRSEYYSHLEFGGPHIPKYGLMHLLACFTQFDGDPSLVNAILDGFLAVTQEELLSAAWQYLRNENRAIVFRVPSKG